MKQKFSPHIGESRGKEYMCFYHPPYSRPLRVLLSVTDTGLLCLFYHCPTLADCRLLLQEREWITPNAIIIAAEKIKSVEIQKKFFSCRLIITLTSGTVCFFSRKKSRIDCLQNALREVIGAGAGDQFRYMATVRIL